MKKGISLIIKNANELLTLRGGLKLGKNASNLGIIKKGAVAIDNGKIVGIGKTATIERKFRGEKVIDALGKVVMPGFVDCHTHLVFAGSREKEFVMKTQGATYLEIMQAGGGILNTARKTRKASKNELKELAEKRLDSMLSFGTTTVEAKSGYGLNLKTELKMLEVIKEVEHCIDVTPTFLGAHAVPQEYNKNAIGYTSFVCEEMIPKVAEKGLAGYCDVFSDKGAFTVKQSEKILKTGIEHGLTPKIHADEIEGRGSAELAARLNSISAAHLLKVSNRGMNNMARKGVIAELLPGTPFVLMLKEYANAREMVEKGVPIALATDLNPNCFTESMQFVLSLACLYMKMTPAEAIASSTINAAYAIEKEKEVGSLEIGKNADILIMDAPDHIYIPYRFGVNLVEKVFKNGKTVFEIER